MNDELRCHAVHTTAGTALVRYADSPGAGVPIVFVHGLGGASTHDYAALTAHPSLTGHRRVLIDLLGSGSSDRPDDFDYTMAAHAAYLHDLLDQVGLARVVLFGHSMAGGIVIPLAASRPERVVGLILSETNLDGGGGGISRPVAAQTEADFVAHGYDALLADARADTPPWAATLALSSPLAIHRESVSLVAGADPSWRELLYGLDCPRCYVFGEHTLPDPDVDELPRHGIPTPIVAGAGHNLAYENPDGLAAVIAAFLRDASLA